MTTRTPILSLAILLLASAVLVAAGRDARQAITKPASRDAKAIGRTKAFPLTVDSIMRGPKLVGYESTGLRWSADSRDPYFEWRRPQDEQSATWVVSRDGGSRAS